MTADKTSYLSWSSIPLPLFPRPVWRVPLFVISWSIPWTVVHWSFPSVMTSALLLIVTATRKSCVLLSSLTRSTCTRRLCPSRSYGWNSWTTPEPSAPGWWNSSVFCASISPTLLSLYLFSHFSCHLHKFSPFAFGI